MPSVEERIEEALALRGRGGHAFAEKLHPRDRLGKFRHALGGYHPTAGGGSVLERANHIAGTVDSLSDEDVAKLTAEEKRKIMDAVAQSSVRGSHATRIRKRLGLQEADAFTNAVGSAFNRLHPRGRGGKFAAKPGGGSAGQTRLVVGGRGDVETVTPQAEKPHGVAALKAVPTSRKRRAKSQAAQVRSDKTRARVKKALQVDPAKAKEPPDAEEVRRKLYGETLNHLKPGQSVDLGDGITVARAKKVGATKRFVVVGGPRQARAMVSVKDTVEEAHERSVAVRNGEKPVDKPTEFEAGYEPAERHKTGVTAKRARSITRNAGTSERFHEEFEKLDNMNPVPMADVLPTAVPAWLVEHMGQRATASVAKPSAEMVQKAGEKAEHLLVGGEGGAEHGAEKAGEAAGHAAEKAGEHGEKAVHHLGKAVEHLDRVHQHLSGKADPGIATPGSGIKRAAAGHAGRAAQHVADVAASSGSGAKRAAAGHAARQVAANVDPAQLEHLMKALTHLFTDRYDEARAARVAATDGTTWTRARALEEVYADRLLMCEEIARRGWDPKQHPRDRRGRYIDVLKQITRVDSSFGKMSSADVDWMRRTHFHKIPTAASSGTGSLKGPTVTEPAGRADPGIPTGPSLADRQRTAAELFDRPFQEFGPPNRNELSKAERDDPSLATNLGVDALNQVLADIDRLSDEEIRLMDPRIRHKLRDVQKTLRGKVTTPTLNEAAALIEELVEAGVLGEAVNAAFNRVHPRDRRGKFRDVPNPIPRDVMNLAPGTGLRTPEGITVERLPDHLPSGYNQIDAISKTQIRVSGAGWDQTYGSSHEAMMGLASAREKAGAPSTRLDTRPKKKPRKKPSPPR